jgi:hypothetical protein
VSDIQKRLSEEYVGVFNRRPGAADLIALDGYVYKYVAALRPVTSAAGAGIWKMICRQVESPGIDFVLAEHVTVTLPPDKLIAALLMVKTPMGAEQANEMVQAILAVLTIAGWTHPDSAALAPLPGTVAFLKSDYTREIVTDDLRPVLAMLQDPEVRTLLVKSTAGKYHWHDLNGGEVLISPDEEKADAE